jgi:hypothetical protein
LTAGVTTCLRDSSSERALLVIRRLLTDTEIRDHLKNLPPSEIEVPRLVLEKTLCPAGIEF